MESKAFEKALEELLGIEKGYSDQAADRGGRTNWGITEKVARGKPYFYDGDMRELPLALAKRIYREQYWDVRRLKLEEVARLTSPEVASEIFEQAVNTGVTSTARRVQEEVLNTLNRDEILYPDLNVDGWLGKKAAEAFNVLMGAGDHDYLLMVLNVAQGKHYLQLAMADPSQEAFLRGWVAKRVTVKGD